MLSPDVIVSLKFYSTEAGGRVHPTNATMFGTIFLLGQAKHDCRLILNEIGSISPGERKRHVPIKFLYPELILSKLTKGLKFYLWDMRNIAEGEIEEILVSK